MFWAGPALSLYEELCLTSFVARGQRVYLHSYHDLPRVPDGVIALDANEILPAETVHQFTFENGATTPTVHANLFRYEALRQLGGWYCDLDVVMLADSPPDTEIYFGREDDSHINCAVLRFPPNHPVMAAAAEAARGLMGSTQWGTSGPRLFTRLVSDFGLQDRALPWAAAYPVRTTEVALMFSPRHREMLEERAASADFIHLWNQIWRHVRIPKELGPPEGSFLDGLFRRFGIAVSPYARLSARAVDSWFEDFNRLADWKRTAADVASLEAQLADARWERDALRRSTSWRITRPLRTVTRMLRGTAIGSE
jgi:hypothetical protein